MNKRQIDKCFEDAEMYCRMVDNLKKLMGSHIELKDVSVDLDKIKKDIAEKLLKGK